MYATFDGVKWYFSAYDMDSTYGLGFDGSGLSRAVSNTNFIEIADAHRVFELIKRFKTDDLKARYNELRANALSETRICQYFENYAWNIPSTVLLEDLKRWPSVNGSAVNGIDQICRWVRQRLEACDAWIEELPAQEIPVEPVEPEVPVEMVNQVPISTDTDGSIYNGVGYKDDTRLSSSGSVSGSAQNGSVTTGFIPCKAYDVIRLKGAVWLGTTSVSNLGHYYIQFYDSNKAPIAGFAESSYSGNYDRFVSITYDETSGITTFQNTSHDASSYMYVEGVQNAAYVRINAYGKGADLIITINQEITE